MQGWLSFVLLALVGITFAEFQAKLCKLCFNAEDLKKIDASGLVG